MKLSTKISVIAVVPVAATLAVCVGTLVWQHRHLERQTESTLHEQALSEATKIAQSVYSMCAGTEQRNQKRLTHSLGVARNLLQERGGSTLPTETVFWRQRTPATYRVRPNGAPRPNGQPEPARAESDGAETRGFGFALRVPAVGQPVQAHDFKDF